ncbi:MAG: cysteine--tRNA ligase [Actinobacteria bacterium]|nr:cysteine--tRNA ligase [Actinomycetota bacterium]MBA3561250.1 cysteine--tRNA ligase [Actinomycetota bacterium]MBA3566106.1 cysteine--tRNA ligase [Actinomycetota bacterium]
MRLYDSLTRGLVELPPSPGPIRIYVCGSTVYQRIHVGNSRPFVLGMWVRNWLRHTGYEVTFVHNITDVDDKVYAEAVEQGVPSRQLSERATAWFFEDTNDLGLGRPDLEPRATETIPEIVQFIQELVDGEKAYVANGDVYFSVARFPEYGRLSGARLEEMISQETSDLKQDQRDFALWKSQKPHEDAAWDSPWGPGRPGWHIECSAMAEKFLGPEFEIHGGGNDLRFPHHENELAQSASLGHAFAKIWMHNGMLELDQAKMSKSLGNVVTLRNVLDVWGRESLLVFHLSGAWSKPVDFDDDVMQQASARADRLRDVFRGIHQPAPAGSWERFSDALDDDFNTPAALAVMHEWRDHELLRRALGVFGLKSLAENDEAPPEVAALAQRRQAAREVRDFEEADRLRAELVEAGWEMRDETNGHRLVRLR